MKKPLTYLAIYIVLCVSLLGCSDDDATPMPPASNVTIVYMVARNNLESFAESDIAEMQQAMQRGNVANGARLLVYLSSYGTAPTLYEIDTRGRLHIMRTYSADTPSVDPSRMHQVLDDAEVLAPCPSRCLVLWSHGTGWLNDAESTGKVTPSSYGLDITPDGQQRMSLPNLRHALEAHTFDFLMFDCCHMATVEVAYELRHISPYILSSPCEIPKPGADYTTLLPAIMQPAPDINQAFECVYNAYESQRYGVALTLVDTAPINRLASITAQILKHSATPKAGYTPLMCFNPSVVPGGLYDIAHYINNLPESTPDELSAWNDALHSTIISERHSAKVFGVPTSQLCGLSFNLPTAPHNLYGYHDLLWYSDVISQL